MRAAVSGRRVGERRGNNSKCRIPRDFSWALASAGVTQGIFDAESPGRRGWPVGLAMRPAAVAATTQGRQFLLILRFVHQG
jgi:hypothetical protein